MVQKKCHCVLAVVLSCRINNKTLDDCSIIEAAKQPIRNQRNGLPGMALQIDSCRLNNQ
jgi:hypothetical protein